MLAKPNKTVIEGTVRRVAPSADGHGHEVEIEVRRNLSAGSSDDFLQPVEGANLHLFSADLPGAAVGDVVRARARLLAGPFGGRTVLEEMKAVSDEKRAND